MSIPPNQKRALSPAKGINLSHALAITLALVWTAPAPALASEVSALQSSDKTAAAKPDLFSQQAAQLRVSACTGLYATLGNAAAAGSSYAVRTEADRTAPNTRPVRGAVGMTYNLPNMKGQAAALISAAPVVGNKCEGQFVRVAPFQIGCSQILRDFPAGSKLIGNLSGVPLYQLGGAGGQALAIPSGENCIVVSVVQGQQQL